MAQIFYINLPVGILAFFLVSRLVQDPSWIKADRANLKRLDYIGLGLMGGMQIVLNKGEENDWFASTFIRVFGVLFVAGMAGLIWWQWRAKNPIMNLRLFKYKNFAICCFLMILVGGVSNAATVLQPQFLQQLMGYTATLAGEALMGGGLGLLVVMPLAGMAIGTFPARNLAAIVSLNRSIRQEVTIERTWQSMCRQFSAAIAPLCHCSAYGSSAVCPGNRFLPPSRVRWIIKSRRRHRAESFCSELKWPRRNSIRPQLLGSLKIGASRQKKMRSFGAPFPQFVQVRRRSLPTEP